MLRQRGDGPHADAEHDEVGGQSGAVAEGDRSPVDAGDALAEMKDDTLLLVQRLDEAANLAPHDAFERQMVRSDHVHRHAPRPQRRGNFETDEARAHHDHVLRSARLVGQRAAVGECAEIVNQRAVRAGNWRMHRLGARGDQKRAVRVTVAVLENDLSLGHIDRRRSAAKQQCDVVLGEVLGRSQRNPVFLRFARQIVLGEVRTVARRRVVGTDDRHRPVVPLAAQRVGGGQARAAAPHDDHRLRPPGGGFRRRSGEFLAHGDPAVRALHLPAGDWIERWRSKRRASAKTEACVMPRTANRIADDQSIGQRTVIVSTERPHRKDFMPDACQKHFRLADPPEHAAALLECGLGDPFGKVW
jgi:hypothetical protein